MYIYIYINYTFVTYLEPVFSFFFPFGAPLNFNEGPYSPIVLNDRFGSEVETPWRGFNQEVAKPSKGRKRKPNWGRVSEKEI